MDRLFDALRSHASAMDNSVAQHRVGIISSFNPTDHTVRVRIQPEDVLSGWIPLGAVSVGSGMGILAPPSSGDQVLLAPQEGDSDSLHVVSRMFSTSALPPNSPATGKPVQSGEVGIFTQGAFLHISGGRVFMQATDVNIKGDLKVDGEIYDKHGMLDRLRDNYNKHDHSQSVGLTTKPDPE